VQTVCAPKEQNWKNPQGKIFLKNEGHKTNPALKGALFLLFLCAREFAQTI